MMEKTVQIPYNDVLENEAVRAARHLLQIRLLENLSHLTSAEGFVSIDKRAAQVCLLNKIFLHLVHLS